MSTIKQMMDTMSTDKKRIRREHSPALKEKILAECEVAGASVAKVAMAHGINANIVHTWRKLARERTVAPVVSTAFMPLTIKPVEQAEHRVAIKVRRGAVSITTSWPGHHRDGCLLSVSHVSRLIAKAEQGRGKG